MRHIANNGTKKLMSLLPKDLKQVGIAKNRGIHTHRLTIKIYFFASSNRKGNNYANIRMLPSVGEITIGC